jgi:hypothetical protein
MKIVGVFDPNPVRFKEVVASVSDPDPDPLDPHDFGPPGSGPTSQRYGSGSSS